MYVDSQIASEVLEQFTDQWVPCLCIHDSFIVPHTRTLELIEVMKAAATHIVGVPIRLSQDYPGLDQFLSRPENTEADYYSLRGFPEPSAGYLHRLEKHPQKKEGKEEEEGRKIS